MVQLFLQFQFNAFVFTILIFILSHFIFQGWETITSAVVKYISDHCSGVVFLLWGSYAQKKASVVNGKKHHLLKSVHPSPLSAHRGFLGCKHFSKCNELLKAQGKDPIDWTKLDAQKKKKMLKASNQKSKSTWFLTNFGPKYHQLPEICVCYCYAKPYYLYPDLFT